MGNEVFRQQVQDELLRLQEEIKKADERITQATGIVEASKQQQMRLIQEMKAVDMLMKNLGDNGEQVPAEQAPAEEELQQPPEGYNEEKQ